MEKLSCPCCGGGLGVIGSRMRGYVDEAGNKCAVSIRRLRCKDCGRIHHELPDFLVPYRRHCAETVERIVDGDAGGTSCECSTLRRIGRWFGERAGHFLGCLESAAVRLGIAIVGGTAPKLRRARDSLGGRRGWLGRLVRVAANTNLWPHTRSAYCPG
ncbi:MAG: DUF6431 domain-containing protein [Clostridiales bacterium]|nr:DUF6431 domain-containing protein [Clostridiales bacterium]